MYTSVVGAFGYLGDEICRALWTHEGFNLVTALDHDDSLDEVEDAEVVVVLSPLDRLVETISWCVSNGKHVVALDGGLARDDIECLERAAEKRPEVGVVLSDTFSLGAVLEREFAVRAARLFDSVDVIDAHDLTKRPGASVASLSTARAISGVAGPEVTDSRSGLSTRGAIEDRRSSHEQVPVHTLQLQGEAAEQSVHFSTPGEELIICSRVRDAVGNVSGVLRAIRYAVEHPGLTVGLLPVLEA